MSSDLMFLSSEDRKYSSNAFILRFRPVLLLCFLSNPLLLSLVPPYISFLQNIFAYTHLSTI